MVYYNCLNISKAYLINEAIDHGEMDSWVGSKDASCLSELSRI